LHARLSTRTVTSWTFHAAADQAITDI
jgi:hypothetical protein